MLNFNKDREIDIIPIGRVAIDFNPVDIHKPLSESTTFKKYLGGSPANIAVGMARLGKKVGFIGSVSNDQFGDFVVDYFQKEGIDTSSLGRVTTGESLGLTFTEIKSPVESSILMYRNGIADLQITPKEVSEEYIKNAKSILISGTALAASPSREACFTAVEYAKKHGTIIIFDIDYRSYTWKSLEEVAIYYTLIGRMSDIIIGSKDEFILMDRLIEDGEYSDEKTAKRWIQNGNKIVVIKHGKEGSIAYTKEGKTYKVKPFPVKLLKSFGGGDAYASAFIYALMENWELIDALEFGSASAAMLVASHACSEDMPVVNDILKFIKEKKNEFGEEVVRA